MKESDINKLRTEKDLFWCSSCQEFKWCPRGSCDAELIGKLVTTPVITKKLIDDDGDNSETSKDTVGCMYIHPNVTNRR